jgi:branched-chain amino acid transport system substrate-binding protein
MRKIFAILLVALLWLNCGKKEEDVIKIGAVFELTGDIADYGNAALHGTQLAIEEVNNKNLLKKKLVLICEDSGNQPARAISSLNKLIAVNDCKLILGGVSSSTTLSMAPLAEKKRVILFSPAASSPKLTNAGEYIFRNYPSDTYEAKILSDNMLKMNFLKIAILYQNNDYGQGLASTFEKDFTSKGGVVVFSESYLPNTSDFRKYINKLGITGSDAYYLPGYYQTVGLLLRQLREAGDKTMIFSSTGIEDQRLFAITMNSAEGVIYPTPSIDFTNPEREVKNFIKKYEDKYHQKPNYPAMLAYDAVNIVVKAMLNCNDQTSVEEIKDQLQMVKNYPGLTGLTTIDKNGDAEKPFRLKKIKSKSFVEYN